MSRRREFLVIAATAIAILVPSLSEASKGKKPKTGKVEGTLVAVASNGVSIQTSTGLVSLAVNSATKVELNDRHVAITALPIGSRTEALFNPTTLIATKVESVN